MALVVLVVIAVVVGFILDPRGVTAGYLAAYASVLGVVLGVLLLHMIVELSGGAWFAPLRRHAQAVIATLPVLALLFVPIVGVAHTLYPWTAPASLSAPLRVAVAARAPYLITGFALVRVVLYWLVWIGVGELVRSASIERDTEPNEETVARMRAVSAAGIPVVALALTFAAFDWLMSISPDWSSSIYALYFFAGASVGALALLAVTGGLALRAANRAATTLAPDTLQALGKLLLTFVLFWAYVGYAQFLIIWIADVPREVQWYAVRARGGWGALGVLLLAGHFVLPVLALLLRVVKRSAVAMIVLGAWMLLMHYLDIYWLVAPRRTLGWLAAAVIDVAALALIVGVTLAFALWRRERPSLLPVRVRRPRTGEPEARAG
jgi:hypothetical protein